MNRRCENNIQDHATNVCDSCYGEFCDECLVKLKTRKYPLCTDCAVIASGVRGSAKPRVLGEKRTARARRKEIASAASNKDLNQSEVNSAKAAASVENKIAATDKYLTSFNEAPEFDPTKNQARLSADFIQRRIFSKDPKKKSTEPPEDETPLEDLGLQEIHYVSELGIEDDIVEQDEASDYSQWIGKEKPETELDPLPTVEELSEGFASQPLTTEEIDEPIAESHSWETEELAAEQEPTFTYAEPEAHSEEMSEDEDDWRNQTPDLNPEGSYIYEGAEAGEEDLTLVEEYEEPEDDHTWENEPAAEETVEPEAEDEETELIEEPILEEPELIEEQPEETDNSIPEAVELEPVEDAIEPAPEDDWRNAVPDLNFLNEETIDETDPEEELEGPTNEELAPAEEYEEPEDDHTWENEPTAEENLEPEAEDEETELIEEPILEEPEETEDQPEETENSFDEHAVSEYVDQEAEEAPVDESVWEPVEEESEYSDDDLEWATEDEDLVAEPESEEQFVEEVDTEEETIEQPEDESIWEPIEEEIVAEEFADDPIQQTIEEDEPEPETEESFDTITAKYSGTKNLAAKITDTEFDPEDPILAAYGGKSSFGSSSPETKKPMRMRRRSQFWSKANDSEETADESNNFEDFEAVAAGPLDDFEDIDETDEIDETNILEPEVQEPEQAEEVVTYKEETERRDVFETSPVSEDPDAEQVPKDQPAAGKIRGFLNRRKGSDDADIEENELIEVLLSNTSDSLTPIAEEPAEEELLHFDRKGNRRSDDEPEAVREPPVQQDEDYAAEYETETESI